VCTRSIMRPPDMSGVVSSHPRVPSMHHRMRRVVCDWNVTVVQKSRRKNSAGSVICAIVGTFGTSQGTTTKETRTRTRREEEDKVWTSHGHAVVWTVDNTRGRIGLAMDEESRGRGCSFSSSSCALLLRLHWRAVRCNMFCELAILLFASGLQFQCVSITGRTHSDIARNRQR
jgi:hypothetical protein